MIDFNLYEPEQILKDTLMDLMAPEIAMEDLYV